MIEEPYKYSLKIMLESGIWVCHCEEKTNDGEIYYEVIVIAPEAVSPGRRPSKPLPMKFNRLEMAFEFQMWPDEYEEDIEVLEERLSEAIVERLQ